MKIELWYRKIVRHFSDEKIRNDLVLPDVAYMFIYSSFSVFVTWCFLIWSFSVIIYMIVSFFGYCYVITFFGTLSQEIVIHFFSESFVQKATQQSDGSCNYTIDTRLFCKLSEKQFPYYGKHIWKKIVCKQYCIAQHDDRVCFLFNCRYHSTLLRDLDDLIE